MPRGISAQRRKAVSDLRAFIAGGMTERQAIDTVNTERVRDGQPPLPRSTAYAYVQIGYRQSKKDASKDVGVLHAISVDTYRRIKRGALTAQKSVFVDGEERRVSDPDHSSAIKAQERLDRITGVDPDSREMMAALERRYMETTIDLLREFLPDEATRERARRWLVHRLESNVTAAGFGDLIHEARAVEVIDQTPAPEHPKIGLPPGTNGNGSTNGHTDSEERE